MNYRHGFHAGNHADVLKHSAWAIALSLARAAPGALFALDTHAGRGGYDLATPEALKSGEFRFGIGRLLAAKDAPGALKSYLEAVRAANPPGALIAYPGSPVIAARALGRGDRLIGCEMNPGESAELARALKPFAWARAETRDGYSAVRALLPPREGRGLVLIDPPFERKDEFDVLATAVIEGARRWPGGQMLAWYALKDRAAADGFLARVAGAGLGSARIYELSVRAIEGASGMVASGLLAVNADAAFDAAMRQAGPFLKQALAQGPGAAWRAQELSPDTAGPRPQARPPKRG